MAKYLALVEIEADDYMNAKDVEAEIQCAFDDGSQDSLNQYVFNVVQLGKSVDVDALSN